LRSQLTCAQLPRDSGMGPCVSLPGSVTCRVASGTLVDLLQCNAWTMHGVTWIIPAGSPAVDTGGGRYQPQRLLLGGGWRSRWV